MSKMQCGLFKIPWQALQCCSFGLTGVGWPDFVPNLFFKVNNLGCALCQHCAQIKYAEGFDKWSMLFDYTVFFFTNACKNSTRIYELNSLHVDLQQPLRVFEVTATCDTNFLHGSSLHRFTSRV